MVQPDPVSPPSLADVRAARERLGERIRTTPTWHWRDETVHAWVGRSGSVHLKLELLQAAGSFKTRGALLALERLDDAARARGVVTVSAGNHAMALSHAGRVLAVSAKVVMPRNANRARIDACSRMGAEVVLVDDVHQAFEEVARIEAEEGRTFVHPFEGEVIATAAGSIGLELLDAVPALDVVVVPIGGGGLCAGIASAIKQAHPTCRVVGVEPRGADSMHRSFAAGEPRRIERVTTIADSLGAPHAAPYSFGLCQRFVDELVLVDDDALCMAMAMLYRDVKLAVEPAGAATTAALAGPLRERFDGAHVGLIVCGANIDPTTFHTYVQRGFEKLAPPC